MRRSGVRIPLSALTRNILFRVFFYPGTIRANFPLLILTAKGEKMNYKEFIQTLQSMLFTRLEAGTTIQVQQIAKNNGVYYDAFIIVSPHVNLSPTIYIPPYYHRYLDGVDLETIVEDILVTYRKNLPVSDFDTTIFTDYQKAKSKIVMRLVNYERNKKLLQSVPHKRFLDFAIIFYCLLKVDATQQASILIYREHLQYWKVDCDDLYDVALCNTPRLLSHYFENMHSLLKEVIHETAGTSDDDLFPMYILSNEYRTYGATVLLYPNLLSNLADSFGKDLVVLPSSVHEVLLLPVDGSPDLKYYTEMVQEVNETQLADDEVLSDHAYLYSRATRLLTFSAVQ